MNFVRASLLSVVLGATLLMTGCFESEADKQIAAAKKAQLFENMFNRGREERYCDFLHRDLKERATCWKEKDIKWKGIPSAYEGEPPTGVVRSTERYPGTDAPKVPLL